MHSYRTDTFIIALRIVFFVVLVVLAMIGPVWLALGIAILAVFAFKNFLELIALGIVCDLLYAPGLSKEIAVFSGTYTIVVLIVYGSIAFLKKRLSWYN